MQLGLVCSLAALKPVGRAVCFVSVLEGSRSDLGALEVLTWHNAQLEFRAALHPVPVVQGQLTNLGAITGCHISCNRNLFHVLGQGHGDLAHVKLRCVWLGRHIGSEVERLALVRPHSVPALLCAISNRDLERVLIDVEVVVGGLRVLQVKELDFLVPLLVLNVLDSPREVVVLPDDIILGVLDVLHPLHEVLHVLLDFDELAHEVIEEVEQGRVLICVVKLLSQILGGAHADKANDGPWP